MADSSAARGHERIETNNLLMIVLILLTVAVGGLVEIVPLFFQRSTTQPVPGPNMPAYPWLDKTLLDPATLPPRMTALSRVGVPYTPAEIAASADAVKGKTELDALVAYLQVLGTHMK